MALEVPRELAPGQRPAVVRVDRLEEPLKPVARAVLLVDAALEPEEGADVGVAPDRFDKLLPRGGVSPFVAGWLEDRQNTSR